MKKVFFLYNFERKQHKRGREIPSTKPIPRAISLKASRPVERFLNLVLTSNKMQRECCMQSMPAK